MLIMIEGSGRWSPGLENSDAWQSTRDRITRSPELAATLEDPSQVFDSDLPTAEDQYRRVTDELSRFDGVYQVGSAVVHVVHNSAGRFSIIIEWNDADIPSVLKLSPLSSGGFTGEWGFSDEPDSLLPLRRIWGSPKEVDLVIKPTIDRWAVRTQSEAQRDLNAPAHDVYVGLGFLLLGQQWMHIGNHEVAGHLPDVRDENEAWSRAHKWTKKLHSSNRRLIIKKVFRGFFDLLVKPDKADREREIHSEPTIGEVAMYGLVSHAGSGNADIPQQWKVKTEQIQEDFKNIIETAHKLYEELIAQG